jgi:hypothetical protein
MADEIEIDNLQWDAVTQTVRYRAKSGGHGGGATSVFDRAATERERTAYFAVHGNPLTTVASAPDVPAHEFATLQADHARVTTLAIDRSAEVATLQAKVDELQAHIAAMKQSDDE